MRESLALSVGLPVALVIIMLGLGLSLRLENFTRVLSHPKPVLIGVVCQAVALPTLCFGLVYLSDMPPAISVGMMLLAASPGATSATIYTHLARGDVALSITHAALTSALVLVTLPIIANIALVVFYGEARTVTVGFGHVLQIFAIAIVPALIGVFIHRRRPELARRLERPVRILATAFIAVIVLLAVIGNWDVVITWGPRIGATMLVYNLSSFAVGYFVPRMLGVERSQVVALAMSVSIHNAALVIALAMSEYMLNNPEMAIPPALYGLLAYITGAGFVWLLNRRVTVPEVAGR